MNAKLGLFMVIASAIFLSGCTNKSVKTENPVVKTEVPDKKGSKEECMTGCIMLWQGNNANDSKPEAEMNKYCNSICDAGQGMQNLDPESCAKSEGRIKDTCYSEIGKKTNNPDMCALAVDPGSQSLCYSAIAISTNNKSLCDKITIGYSKTNCLKKFE